MSDTTDIANLIVEIDGVYQSAQPIDGEGSRNTLADGRFIYSIRNAWPTLRAALLENQRDAKRYRFLRDPLWPCLGQIYDKNGAVLRVTESRNIQIGADAPTGDRLDAAIDAALLSKSEGEGR